MDHSPSCSLVSCAALRKRRHGIHHLLHLEAHLHLGGAQGFGCCKGSNDESQEFKVDQPINYAVCVYIDIYIYTHRAF